MRLQWPLLIPLACAFTYVFSVLTLKRAAAFGVGVWRANFVANWAMLVAFLPAWFWQGGQIHPLSEYWQPALTALLFLGGQTFTFLALNCGDVSVTTPVMGTKVILVALFTSWLKAGEVPLRWWIGAACSSAAISLLHLGDRSGHRHVRQTVLLAFCSATSFSLGDVLLQKWVRLWGVGNYFPPMFLFGAIFSLGFIPFFSAPLTALSVSAWRWVVPGALLMALNNAGIVLALGIWGDATAVNIVYSVRGLLSVVLVWSMGHWFASEEKHLSGLVLRARLVGATLTIAAIVMVLI